MSKITLGHAKRLLKEIQLIDVFASLIGNDLEEDNTTLQTYLNLTNKIYRAEKHFSIDEIKHSISLLEKQAEYYRPDNVVFYYKQLISQEIKDSNKDTWNGIKEEISKLAAKIEQLSEHIFIEV